MALCLLYIYSHRMELPAFVGSDPPMAHLITKRRFLWSYSRGTHYGEVLSIYLLITPQNFYTKACVNASCNICYWAILNNSNNNNNSILLTPFSGIMPCFIYLFILAVCSPLLLNMQNTVKCNFFALETWVSAPRTATVSQQISELLDD